MDELAKQGPKKRRGSGFRGRMAFFSCDRRADTARPDRASGPAGRAIEGYSFHIRPHLLEPILYQLCGNIATAAAKTSCPAEISRNF
jgi:hypothetical protein